MDDFIVKEFEVRPVMKRAYCPDCDIELERDNVILNTHPATYQYFCPKCGYGYRSLAAYPVVSFDEVKEDIES